MNIIQISNLSANSINKSFLKRIAEKVLKKQGRKGIELSIVLTGLAKIKKLNKKYRKKNKATDVLSFLYNNDSLKAELIGEIFICLPEVRKNAKKLNLSFENELSRILIHGILHLLGYDHEQGKKKAEEMTKKEKEYFKLIN
jgi:probable rRNA maturation factor